MEKKNAKEKEWYSKMNGFLSSKKHDEIEKQDEEEKILKEKLYRQTFGEEAT